MPISQVNNNDRLRATMAAAAQRRAGAYPTTPSPARQADAIDLSETARAMSVAQKSVASAPDVRQDRVDALKAAINDGTYKIDSRQLAAAMVRKLDLLA